MRDKIAPFTAACLLLLVGCSSSDPTASGEYAALEQELATITAERDLLAGQAQAMEQRYEKAKTTQDTVLAIIEDPTLFGTEEEVLDLLDTLAVPDVVSGDMAWGGTSTGRWRIGWSNTLFGEVDATIRTWTSWLSQDGSIGGSLWTWSGTAQSGERFDLQGLELSRFNEDGLYTELVMLYPYENDEVHRRFREGT